MVHELRQELLVDKHAAYITAISQVRLQSALNDGFLLQSELSQFLDFILAVFADISLQSKASFAYYATEHFRMSGVYWGLTALYLLDKLDAMDEEDVVSWVLTCQHPNGGFGGSERHDPHMLYTLSALQILALYDKLDKIDADKVVECEYTVCSIVNGLKLSLCTAFLRFYFFINFSVRLIYRCGGASAARRFVCW